MVVCGLVPALATALSDGPQVVRASQHGFQPPLLLPLRSPSHSSLRCATLPRQPSQQRHKVPRAPRSRSRSRRPELLFALAAELDKHVHPQVRDGCGDCAIVCLLPLLPGNVAFCSLAGHASASRPVALKVPPDFLHSMLARPPVCP